ncbi:MAG TPA: PA14 domain-containing protein [bacterium]|nr:PA14 domain-containing protein [bacterium]
MSPKRRKSSAKASRRGTSLWDSPWVQNGVKILSLLFLGAGQWGIFTGRQMLGLVFSLLAVMGGLSVYYGRDILGWLQLPFPAGKGKKNIGRKAPAKKLGPLAILRGVGTLAALLLAGIGQHYWGTYQDHGTLIKGGWFFLPAIALFVACFWPYLRERLKNIEIPLKWEIGIGSAILLAAIFLRVFRIASVPSGLFIDQGFEGLAALRILHEGWRPLYVEDVFHAYALALYQLALWFKIFGSGEVTLKLFFAFLSILGLPLVYWTFRQLAGPRVALLTLFILTFMRWHITFSRNGFPSIELPIYMFGTIGFLLYGLRTQKRWPYIAAAFFFAAGFYTYQAFKVMPVLLLFYAIYETAANLKIVRKQWVSIGIFMLLSIALSYPIFDDIVIKKNFGTREKLLAVHSWQQFVSDLSQTALMFNRHGDENSRHNPQNLPMLDQVSGALFILGLAYAVFRIHRRKYFYAVMGFLVMSLPCLLSVDPAHANRMLGVTPFLAFIIATPIAALWGRVVAFWGPRREWTFFIAAAPFLWNLAAQNCDLYFRVHANNLPSIWEYCTEETVCGRMIAQNGDGNDYYVSPRYFDHYSMRFLGYFEDNRIHNLELPRDIAPPAEAPRDAFFFIAQSRTGVVDLFKTYYPKAWFDTLVDPGGNTLEYFFRVPADTLEPLRGLQAKFDRPVGGKTEQPMRWFPAGLPAGPYHATLTGNLYVPDQGDYSWKFTGNCHAVISLKGRPVTSGTCYLEKGIHPIRISLTVPEGKAPTLEIQQERVGKKPVFLEADSFNSLPHPRGLVARFYKKPDMTGEPFLVEWDSVLDFPNGNDIDAFAPYSIHWTGELNLDKSGQYQFFLDSRDKVGMKIDGKAWITLGDGYRKSGNLTAGKHKLDLYYSKADPYFPNFTFKWVRPGGSQEVVPNSVFGEVP